VTLIPIIYVCGDIIRNSEASPVVSMSDERAGLAARIQFFSPVHQYLRQRFVLYNSEQNFPLKGDPRPCLSHIGASAQQQLAPTVPLCPMTSVGRLFNGGKNTGRHTGK